jgi:hypothetical protein
MNFEQPHLCPDCLERAARAVAQSGSRGLIYLEYCRHVAGGTLARIVAYDGGVSQMVLSAPTSPKAAAEERARIAAQCGPPVMRDGEPLN